MSLVQLRLDPGKQELRRFGALLAALFIVMAGLSAWRHPGTPLPLVLVTIGIVEAVVFYAIPSLQLYIYRGWVRLTYPLGWLISGAVLLAVYFLVLTPVALLRRIFGRTMLNARSPDATAWQAHDRNDDLASSFNEY